MNDANWIAGFIFLSRSIGRFQHQRLFIPAISGLDHCTVLRDFVLGFVRLVNRLLKFFFRMFLFIPFFLQCYFLLLFFVLFSSTVNPLSLSLSVCLSVCLSPPPPPPPPLSLPLSCLSFIFLFSAAFLLWLVYFNSFVCSGLL